MWENTDQKNSEYGLFSRNASIVLYGSEYEESSLKTQAFSSSDYTIYGWLHREC